MTNKYFTPKLEDIRINYICEIPHKEKDDWELVSKYTIGKKKVEY